MVLLNSAPMIDIDPDDNKRYEYKLNLREIISHDRMHYIYNFTRASRSIDDNDVTINGKGYQMHNEEYELIVDISHTMFSDDAENLENHTGKCWNYMWHKYNHETPMKITYWFDDNGCLRFDTCTTVEILEPFNQLINSDQHDADNIYEVNLWIKRNSSVEETLIEFIKNLNQN